MVGHCLIIYMVFLWWRFTALCINKKYHYKLNDVCVDYLIFFTVTHFFYFSGIDKKKAKSSMVWDDVVKNWVPRFGYKKVKVEQEKNWMMHYKVC